MDLQSWEIFEKKKNVIFRHLYRLKMVWDPDHRAKKIRFEILRLPGAFSVRSEITFDPLLRGWNVTDGKNWDFLFKKKNAIKGSITSNTRRKIISQVGSFVKQNYPNSFDFNPLLRAEKNFWARRYLS